MKRIDLLVLVNPFYFDAYLTLPEQLEQIGKGTGNREAG